MYKRQELISIVKNECYITFKMSGIDIDIKIENIIYCQYIGNHIVSIIYGNKMINVNNEMCIRDSNSTIIHY